MAKNERNHAPTVGDSPISVLLYGAQKTSGIRCADLEAWLGVSGNTLRKWMKHPEDVSMRQIERIAKILGVSKTHLCAAWRW